MYLPKKVAELVDDVRKNIDVEPNVDKVGDRRYRVTITNERVHCTVDYKFTGNRWEWADSKLTVDGNRIAIMPNPAAFYRLFQNPDTFGLKKADLTILNQLTPIDLDALGMKMFKGIIDYTRRRLEPIDPNTTVELHTYRDSPALLIKTIKSTMIWGITASGWSLRFIELDGWDFTERMKDKDLETIFGIVAESHGVALPPPPSKANNPLFNSAPAMVSNAVRTRKQTVIRT